MLSKRMRNEVDRCRKLYGGVEEYDAASMDGWIAKVATLEQRIKELDALKRIPLDAIKQPWRTLFVDAFAQQEETDE